MALLCGSDRQTVRVAFDEEAVLARPAVLLQPRVDSVEMSVGDFIK